jgi:hypothetical protein
MTLAESLTTRTESRDTEEQMPVISRFFGIVVYMHWRDHAPPHFHAKYQNQEISIEIESGRVVGQMGAKAVALVQEWRQEHRSELLANWLSAERKQTLRQIPPLE